jgi:hypothetical protein
MRPPPRPTSPAATDQELCLLGATGLADFLSFVQKHAVGGRSMDAGELAQQWRDAAMVYEALQQSEAGAADKPEVLPLPEALQAHVKRLLKVPSFEHTFSRVPVAFGMVPLDRLVAYQQHLTQATVDAMLASLRPPLPEGELAALCLPLEVADNGLRLLEQDASRVVFEASNHDVRFHGARVLAPAQVSGLRVSGHVQAVVGLALGGTTNVLNVVRYGSRYVLNNGYHRAWALLRLGVTHAPCVIQVCAHWEDVGLVGAGEMFHNGPVYFSQARPPMLRDFGHPQLARSFLTYRTRKQIRVTFQVETSRVRA